MMRQHMKWVYAIAGGGIVVGIINYFQEGMKCAHTSWTTNFTPSVKWDSNWDRREFTKPSKSVLTGAGDKENVADNEKDKAVPTATRHLIFVRHGQYNLKGVSDADRQLTALGRSQAELTGSRLKELNFTYNRIVQSTLTRAMETAALIHKYIPHLPLDSCNLLCEGAPIPPEPPIGHWRPEAHQFFEDGARIEAAFRKYFHRADASQKNDSYEIFVCHANVIRYFICRALQFPPESWLRFSLHNCSLTWIAIRPSGRVIVFNVGDCGHLPPDMLTRS